jgi:glycosyltransferase involved in cell wall biosynthesis
MMMLCADFKLRGELMAGARALLAPTLGIEPFGGVAAEAQICGTPVITTDWGGFVDTVQHGMSGYRCRTMDEFVAAVYKVDSLDRSHISARARSLFADFNAAEKYEKYFKRIQPQIDRAPILT